MSADRALRRPADLADGGRRGRREGDPDLRWPPGFAATGDDRAALTVLLGMAALTPRRLLALAQDAGTASGCLRAVRTGRAGSEGDRAYARSHEPDREWARVAASGARLVAAADPDYPAPLDDLFDPPAGVFVRGAWTPGGSGAVAIVGARACTPTGREVTMALGAALAAAGATVVSGGARGIDAAAHEGALRGGGPTVAVLGCGIDVAYPPGNRELLRRVTESGGLLSEYPPGVRAEPFRFPARNRIVAALGHAVVVVEGAAGSGSMITAEHALDLGREVFAVPGPVTSPLAAVPLSLIREGATLIRGPADLLEDLGMAPLGGAAVAATGEDPGGLGEEERRVWRALVAPSPADGLAAATGLSLPAVLGALAALELRGLVRPIGGRYERRVTG